MSIPTITTASREGGLSLDGWIALNDEILALVRAGLPLGRGLMGAGGDLRGRVGGVSRRLGERVQRGEGLAEALAAEGAHVPPVYRAVVEAGIRAGRLPAALEGLAVFARNYAEMRRAIGLALIYPLIVVTLAYGLFLGFITLVVPRFQTALIALGVPNLAVLDALGWLGETAPYWGPAVPALVVVGALAWALSGRAGAFPAGPGGGLLGWVPGMRRLISGARAAGFAEMLALLVEQGVGLGEALTLAGTVSGDRTMARDAGQVAEALHLGADPADVLRSARAIPPLLRWAIISGFGQAALVTALRHAARSYRLRAAQQAELIRAVLPTALVVVVGASATLLYTLALFIPFSALLLELSVE